MSSTDRHDDQTSGLDRRDRDVAGLLGTYLNDHRAGGAAGRTTAERSRAANLDNELGRYLGEFLGELEIDAALLDEVRQHVGSRSSTLKQAVADVAAQLGRLKFNGRLVGYSPSSRVLEIEGLQMAVHGKRAMWNALAELQRNRPDLTGFDFDTPQQRATLQLERLDHFHVEAVRTAFL